MIAWRICRAPFAALDGEGGRLFGGRWNSEGAPVVYAASSLSLAALEYLVHMDPGRVPDDLMAMRIEIPDGSGVDRVGVEDLPVGWNGLSEHVACIGAGDAWVDAGRTLVLCVPSAVVPEEENVLVNPGHRGAAGMQVMSVRPFAFDSRLLE